MALGGYPQPEIQSMTTIYSPARVGILMHIHCFPTAFPNRDAPIMNETLGEFLEDGVIRPSTDNPCGFELTDRGRAWVKSICDTPIPLPAWVDRNGQVIKP